jgi:hypothetical protein
MFARVLETTYDHGKEELERAGLLDKDSDYDGMLGDAVLELLKVFGNQGHSGMSAMMTIDLFDKLAKQKNLTPITDDPAEWMNVQEYYGKDGAGQGMKGVWQNRRDAALFSNDGGKTYYSVDDENRDIKKAEPHGK